MVILQRLLSWYVYSPILRGFVESRQSADKYQGGSAGGGAVLNQMILYGGEANPPFRAVISERPWVSGVRSAGGLSG